MDLPHPPLPPPPVPGLSRLVVEEVGVATDSPKTTSDISTESPTESTNLSSISEAELYNYSTIKIEFPQKIVLLLNFNR